MKFLSMLWRLHNDGKAFSTTRSFFIFSGNILVRMGLLFVLTGLGFGANIVFITSCSSGVERADRHPVHLQNGSHTFPGDSSWLVKSTSTKKFISFGIQSLIIISPYFDFGNVGANVFVVLSVLRNTFMIWVSSFSSSSRNISVVFGNSWLYILGFSMTNNSTNSSRSRTYPGSRI